jgi:hypothetical protein
MCIFLQQQKMETGMETALVMTSLSLATFRLIDDSMTCSFVVLHLLACVFFNLLQGHLSCNVLPKHIYRKIQATIIWITSAHIKMSLPGPSPSRFPFSAVEERYTYIIHMFKYNACTYIWRRIWRACIFLYICFGRTLHDKCPCKRLKNTQARRCSTTNEQVMESSINLNVANVNTINLIIH